MQVELLKPYTNALGTLKPKGYRTLMSPKLAMELINQGIAKEYKDSDLKMVAQREIENMQIANDMAMIDTPPKKTLFQKIKTLFTK